MRIATVSLSGQRQVSREEIFAATGVTNHSSLLFLDVAQARAKLEAIPWIAEATVRKLYPDRLQITITEREAFALWQRQGKVSVIAADGTVLAASVEPRLASLPFVVGKGAAAKARGFLAVLDQYPAIRDQVRASILVGGAALEPAAEERHRRAAARYEHRTGARNARALRPREKPAHARHRRDRSAASRPPHRSPLGRRRAGARGSFKKTTKKKGSDA